MTIINITRAYELEVWRGLASLLLFYGGLAWICWYIGKQIDASLKGGHNA